MSNFIRLPIAFILVLLLGMMGADLALASHLAITEDRPTWSVLLVPIRESWQHGIQRLASPMNLLVIGTDTLYDRVGRPIPGLSGHADTLIFVQVHPGAGRIEVLSLPRDTLVTIPGHGPHKLNQANYLGGTLLIKRTVENLLELQVHRTVRLDMHGLKRIIDEIGGMDLVVERALHYDDHAGRLHIHFGAGQHHLDGQKAMEFLRFRHDPLGDIGRIRRQQSFVTALLSQMIKPRTLLKLSAIVNAFESNVESDLAAGELWHLAVWYCLGAGTTFHHTVLPGKFGRRAGSSIWQVDLVALNRVRDRFATDWAPGRPLPWTGNGRQQPAGGRGMM